NAIAIQSSSVQNISGNYKEHLKNTFLIYTKIHISLINLSRNQFTIY
ncbi:hypothetical protein LEP1GSC170_0160, partial [Leptospira interrogans serovar Bataviae str. HAI135]